MQLKPDYVHPELVAALPFMTRVADCYYANVSKYLPDPTNVNDDPAYRRKRFDEYKAGAVYFNVVRQTAKTLSGLVFSQYPTVDLPDGLQPLVNDIDGAGMTLAQQARAVLIGVLLRGRAGLLADFPINEGAVSKADVERLGLKPSITAFKADDIINWRVTGKKLSLVVVNESYEESDDGFEIKYGQQLLALRLEDGVATAERYRKGDAGWYSLGKGVITDNAGKPFDIIPFTFIGADNNDPVVDDSPLYDLAAVNIAHFRNSADYEDSVHLVGQPTLFVSGLTDTWGADDTDPIVMGSRSAHLIPLQAKAEFVSAPPNTLVKEALEDKKAMMIALGAKLTEPNSSTKTATEAGGDQADEGSTLTTIANNISDAYSLACLWAGRFAGVDGDCVVTLNTNYTIAKLSSQDIVVLLQLWQSSAISFEELRNKLLEGGIASIENAQDALEMINMYLPQPVFSD